MDFKEATDRATGSCITLADIGEACGVTHHAVRRARLEGTASSFRQPPEGWERCLARLARKRAAELTNLANDLEG